MQILNHLSRWVARLLRFRSPTTDVLSIWARKIQPRANLQPLSLSDSQKAKLTEISQRARDTSHQRSGPTLVLFAGAGATDQADAVEAMANDVQRDLYRVDLNMVVSKYIGETEFATEQYMAKNVTATFTLVTSTT